MLLNFQFSICNFQSKLKSLKFKKSLQVIFIFSLFLASIFYLLSSAAPTHAVSQATSAAQTNTQAATPPNNLHNWTQNVMIETMLALTCQLVGVDPTRPDGQCLGVDQKTGKIGFLPAGNLKKREIGGAIGGMNNMISMLYTPPIHASDYFQNLASNFGIAKKTYAAKTGTGFDSLKPLLELWVAFRNIVYLVFVIVFVAIGLAIMLRIKIDPRTVMTIQNQIPKIIMGILLVTFSFAIAGFLVDMMWVSIHLIYGLISGVSQDIAKNVSELSPTSLQGKSPFSGVGGVGNIFGMANTVALNVRILIGDLLNISPIPLATFGNIFDALKGLNFYPSGKDIPNFLIDLISVGAGLLTGSHWAQIIGDKAIFGWTIPTGTIAGATAGFATFGMIEALLRFIIPYGLVFLIVFVALFTALFRLWLALLMAYISILLDVVLAPFWIMGSLVPGSPINVGGWFRDLAANLAAFPAVILMFLLARVFMDGFAKATNPFVPPLIGDLGNQDMFSTLIGIGVILMTPNIVTMLKTALKAPKTDMGIGKALAPGLATPGRVVGGSVSTAFAPHYDSKTGQLMYPGGTWGRFLRGFGFVH